jgi:N-acetylglutamate synthase
MDDRRDRAAAGKAVALPAGIAASHNDGAAARLAWRAEEAGINGFPALRQMLLAGWLLRFSDNVVRRTANSATPLAADPADVEALIAGAAALYCGQRQPTIFRIPSLVTPAVDARLAGLGYSSEGESCVIYGAIGAVAAAADAEVRLLPRPAPGWCAAMAALQGHTAEQRAIYRRIVGAILLPAAFASLSVDGEAVALAYGVIHDRLLCFESVVTHTGRRRRGFARRVLGALAAWGRDSGATGACLQVEAPNAPARALYDGFGLTTELYRYHYRREPQADRR